MSGVSTTHLPRPVSDRPLAVLDIIDGAFAALRQRPRAMVGAVLPIVVPLRLLEAWVNRGALGGVGLSEMWSDPAALEAAAGTGWGGEAWILGWLVDSAIISIAGVAVAHLMAGWLEGRDPTGAQALLAVARRWWVVLAAWLLVRVIQVVATSLFVLPGFFAVVLLCAVSPVVAFERRGPLASVRRSVALLRPRLGPVMGVVLLTAFVSFVVAQAIEAIPVVIAAVLGPDQAWPLVAAAGILSSLVLVPFVAASATLVYLDQRYRTEGLDLELEALEVLPDGA